MVLAETVMIAAGIVNIAVMNLPHNLLSSLRMKDSASSRQAARTSEAITLAQRLASGSVNLPHF